MSAAPLPPLPGASPTRAETALPRLVHLGLQVIEPADVLAYLERHPDLAALLAAMVDEVRGEFGTAGELILRLYRDPEVQDEYLSLYVRQWPYDARVMDRMNEISRRFEDELAECSGWLLLTSDFRRPGGADAAV